MHLGKREMSQEFTEKRLGAEPLRDANCPAEKYSAQRNVGIEVPKQRTCAPPGLSANLSPTRTWNEAGDIWSDRQLILG
jgi:hypothetical protein